LSVSIPTLSPLPRGLSLPVEESGTALLHTRACKIVHLTSVHSALDPRIFKKECRSLARAGFHVTVVGPHPQDTVEELVHIRAVKKYRSRIARMTRTVWHVFQHAKELDADVYHFHDPELILVALLLRSSGKNVVYDIHEDYPKDILFKSYLPRWSRGAVARLAEHFEKAACRHLSAIVSVTPSIAARLQASNPRTIVLYNYPYPEELIGEDPALWKDRKLAATYVGTITPQRGISQIVRAMELLSDSLEATLEIAGDHMPEPVMKLKGWSRVRFHGPLDQPNTYRLLRQARVGLMCQHPIPPFLESIPVKLFEYMGAGLPVVASDFPLWRTMLDDLQCAIFVDPFNVREIARAIEYLLTHPHEAEEMGRRGQAAVMDHLNWNTQAPKLVNLYAELMSRPCAG
jgi:glycosyltransferase involved in cell wall biosynthesis